MTNAARVGDEGSHGGEIITGSDVRQWDGRKAARINDIYDCPEHGPNPIIEGSSVVIIDGRKAARKGDHTACGAVITTGSDVTFIPD